MLILSPESTIGRALALVNDSGTCYEEKTAHGSAANAPHGPKHQPDKEAKCL